MNKVQEELAQAQVEGTSGGGAVRVTVNGQMKVLAVKISPDAVASGDAEMLEDLVLSAISDAMTKAQDMAQSRLGALTGGLKIPGIM